MSDVTASAGVNRRTAWVAIASAVAGVLDAVSTIACLRLGVTTAEFGAATLAVALFPIVDRLGGIGLIAATVREPETDEGALSSICWLGVTVAGGLTAVLLVARPLIAAAFPDPIVATLLAAYGARLLFRHLSVVPEAMMKRALRDRELSMVRIAASLTETAVKCGSAYLGTHGPRELAIWCFVLGPIANAIVTTIGTLWCYPWRPRLVFRRDVAARSARFTASLSGGELLYFAYTSADYLVVGAWFGKAAVGVYRLAYELVLDVVRLVSLVTTEVAFPMFARLAADRGRVAEQFMRFTRQNLIVLAPFLIYVAVEADDLLALLFGVLPPAATTAARVLCIVGALRTLGFILSALLAGVGRPSRVLAYNAIAAVVLPTAFVVAAAVAPEHGYVAVAWAWVVGYPIAFGTLLAMALSCAGLGLGSYARGIAGIVVCAAGAMGAALTARVLLPDMMIIRTLCLAPIVLAAHAFLLARIEGVTVSTIVAALREEALAGNRGM